MHLILTHEQADFDALASLLGAYLLNDAAIPVLPRRMNRNVRAFLTLYGAELPFVEARDLPAGRLESVTLVDTQSLVSLKGFSHETSVHVVDHHPARENLPASWKVNIETTGATATLFVEALREHNGALPALHSTLLLLGIYEDTGSLTYSRTTARDLLAAAFLVEHGANLRLAVDFLNHPLSPQQQELYEKIREAARTLTIHGHTIILACGDAQDTDEELSTLAHKLRDLLDPDALFLVVQTRSGIQIIARSTTDHIDVAQIAASFGGGGHDRAAAALVRERTLESVCTELTRLLPGLVRPAITVAQIMSRRPQVLSPDTPVHEAHLRMQRYGYEGYPVVQDGQVVGLLTRRAVDRAIAHKLNLSAASLMEAGNVSVAPQDSIEHLQQVMTTSGWGQVPVVVRPEEGSTGPGTIVGIVTRTDLIKTLTPSTALPGHLNLAGRLEAAIPPERLAILKAVAETAHTQHLAAYVVGGFVRDLLLERPSLDFDIVVEGGGEKTREEERIAGSAIALARAMATIYGGRVTSHARFGTAKWHLGPQTLERFGLPAYNPARAPAFLDLISARTEFYTHPTALPTVERGSIKLDLHRRDFTINTLALRLDGRHFGEMHDYWGGLGDLKRGVVRVLHSVSFVDDPTRMLRAVRFEQRFGFQIEERTLQLLGEALPLLGRVSGDRIRHELDHVLEEEHALAMLARLDQLGVLAAIHPELKWDEWMRAKWEAFSAEGRQFAGWNLPAEIQHQPLERLLFYALWLLHLTAGAADGEQRAAHVLERLKVPSSLAADILAAIRVSQALPGLTGRPPSAVVAHLSYAPLLAVAAAFVATEISEQATLLETYATRWSRIFPHTTGNTLRARGLPPGPQYGRILAALRNAWLDGNLHSAEEEDALLAQLLQTL